MTSSLLHPYLASAEEVEQALDKLATFEPAFLSLPEKRKALLSLARLTDRLQALYGRVIVTSDDVAGAEGHRDVAAWLTHHTRAAQTTSRRAMRATSGGIGLATLYWTRT